MAIDKGIQRRIHYVRIMSGFGLESRTGLLLNRIHTA